MIPVSCMMMLWCPDEWLPDQYSIDCCRITALWCSSRFPHTLDWALSKEVQESFSRKIVAYSGIAILNQLCLPKLNFMYIITWTSYDKVPQCHVFSQGHNELILSCTSFLESFSNSLMTSIVTRCHIIHDLDLKMCRSQDLSDAVILISVWIID